MSDFHSCHRMRTTKLNSLPEEGIAYQKLPIVRSKLEEEAKKIVVQDCSHFLHSYQQQNDRMSVVSRIRILLS
ncbi:hypothetical protein MtrunA17_Chr3g0083661 [Medicago truncatula]|uniref:Uncharacterized protein n=1 Tax=Medicago truncatula TaxID=3880 RepID=A0A396IJC8_MEDTR|nr:hypothetical protein MtrunA17_Chr3g0083661 [Medicago truncatula]